MSLGCAPADLFHIVTASTLGESLASGAKVTQSSVVFKALRLFFVMLYCFVFLLWFVAVAPLAELAVQNSTVAVSTLAVRPCAGRWGVTAARNQCFWREGFIPWPCRTVGFPRSVVRGAVWSPFSCCAALRCWHDSHTEGVVKGTHHFPLPKFARWAPQGSEQRALESAKAWTPRGGRVNRPSLAPKFPSFAKHAQASGDVSRRRRAPVSPMAGGD